MSFKNKYLLVYSIFLISCDVSNTESDTEEKAPSSCGGNKCAHAPAEGFDTCCTSNDKCGYVIYGFCIEPNLEPGKLDNSCPASSHGDTCCTSEGECGVFFPDLDACVLSADLGDEPHSCEYESICEQKKIGMACDGPEDCAEGEICCGQYQDGTLYYLSYQCYSAGDCVTETNGRLEMCHTDDDCHAENETCLSSTYLPEGLARCYSVGSPVHKEPTEGIPCGDVTCAVGEKCCLDNPNASAGPLKGDCIDQDGNCECAEYTQ